jgi:hypothetical protein
LNYIIRKVSRDTKEPYLGISCTQAGIPTGKTYTDYNEALADASKLQSVNPVGFEVVSI